MGLGFVSMSPGSRNIMGRNEGMWGKRCDGTAFGMNATKEHATFRRGGGCGCGLSPVPRGAT